MAGKLIDLSLLTYYHNKLESDVLANKVDKVSGKQLSTNDYTNEEKAKLEAVETGAQRNVKPDWNAASGAAAEILNKPTALPADGGNADTVNGHTVEIDVPDNAVFTDTTYTAFTGATSGVAGRAGLVPAPTVGDRGSFLKGDGTWATPEQVTVGTADGETPGIVKGGAGSDVTITSGIITVNDDSHNHTISTITGLQDALDAKADAGDLPPVASSSQNGLMSAADKAKLDAIENEANKTVIEGSLSSTSNNAISSKAVYTALQGYVPSTTTINGVPLTGGNVVITAEDLDVIPSTDIGAANGIASLDEHGRVPSAQLPSYVDDVVEGYYHEGKFYTSNLHTQEITAESGKIYVDLDTSKMYRWSGTIYVEISSSLALGETSSTAFRGDYGKIAYDFAIGEHAPVNAEANVINEIKVNGVAQEVSSKSVNIDLSGYAPASSVTLATTGEIDALFTA